LCLSSRFSQHEHFLLQQASLAHWVPLAITLRTSSSIEACGKIHARRCFLSVVCWVWRQQQPVDLLPGSSNNACLSSSAIVHQLFPHPPTGQLQCIQPYWFLDTSPDWQPPATLLAFLEAGPPPVYIGFGSMTSRNVTATTDIILKALKRSKQRGIIAAGWNSLGSTDLPDTVYSLEEAPHDWLFPRMAAVVHHAGAGTTAAGLRAGVPNVAVPFYLDQPFWAERIRCLGVGPRPIPRKHLTSDNLAHAITTAVSDQLIRSRAARIGACIRAENGIDTAVQIIQKYC